MQKDMNMYLIKASEFVSSDIVEQQIEEEFLNKFASLEHYEARKISLVGSTKRVRHGIFYEKILTKMNKKNSIKDTEQKTKEKNKTQKQYP